jgi:exonuclease SbcD
VDSRDGRETALVAALPWVTERKAVEFATLSSEPGASLNQYADAVVAGMNALTGAFRPETINVLTAHFLVDGSLVGERGTGGERELHMSQGIYGVRRERIPVAAQYVAAGHVHKAQPLRASPAAWYSGSLLQLDFGEREQNKSVNLVEVHAGQPAKVEQLPITSGRRLVDIGSPGHGVSLNELPERAAAEGDAWLRVFIDIDMPVANLAAMVKETLPNAVHVQRVKQDAPAAAAPHLSTNAVELFQAFYRSSLGQGREASAETIALFERLLDEETHAAADA